MRLLDKLRERINNSRVSGVVMTEDFVMSPIPFRTRHGGSRPGDFIETRNMKNLKKDLYQYIGKIIDAGLTDEYSDPKMFDIFIEAHFKQVKNDLAIQCIRLDEAAKSIIEVEKESYLKGKRKEAQLRESIPLKHNLKKGIGEKYEDIQEK